MVTVAFIWCFSCFNWFSYCRGNCICAGQGNTVVSHFVVQRGVFTVAIACVPCGPRRSLIYAWAWGFCVCWKLSAAEKVKPDCCRTPAVVSILSPFLTGRMFVRPNILRTLRRTMIRFLIEHLVRRIWFGQSRLYFILNWLVFGPNLRQTRSRQHDRKCRLKSSQSSQYTLIIPHRVIQLTTISFWVSPRQGCAFHKSTQVNK